MRFCTFSPRLFLFHYTHPAGANQPEITGLKQREDEGPSALGDSGIGFGLPCIIYTNEKLSRSVQIAIHMVTGCAIMLTIAFLVGWIPTDKGLLPALLAVVSMLLTAFVISVFSYRRQKKLAERINRELELRRQ